MKGAPAVIVAWHEQPAAERMQRRGYISHAFLYVETIDGRKTVRVYDSRPEPIFVGCLGRLHEHTTRSGKQTHYFTRTADCDVSISLDVQ